MINLLQNWTKIKIINFCRFLCLFFLPLSHLKLQRELKMIKNPNFENTKTIDRTMQWT